MGYQSMVGRVQRLPRFDVNESLLRWALNRSNKSVDELIQKQDLRSLDKWLAGTKKPTRPQLEAFAKATYTPFGYLLLSKPPHIQPSRIPHFRTMKTNDSSKRSIDLEDTIRITEHRQEWIREYLKEIGAEPLKFVGSSNIDDNPVDVANKIRTTLGLRQDWAVTYSKWESAQEYLQKQIENTRIFLSVSSVVQHNIHRKLDPEEFRGFVLVDDYAPFIFVNSADIGGAQMFTLAHELAHIWIGESASFDLRDLTSAPDNELELVCNKIAAEFLVPTEEIHLHWNLFAKSSADQYTAASRHFKVSRIVAARRALDANCISQEDFSMFYDDYVRQAEKKRQEVKKERRDKKGGPPFHHIAPSRISKRFMLAVITAVQERRIHYRQAYSLTGLKSETFDTIKNRMEGGRHE